MNRDSSPILFSFLGTGDYQSTHYSSAGKAADTIETPFVALALAKLYRVGRTVILATEVAEAKHGAALRASFAIESLVEPELVRLPNGQHAEELWTTFEILRSRLAKEAQSAVLFDITHGFRAQPFFAAAVIGYLRGLDQGLDDLRVVYGAFEARDQVKNMTPIWDLTAFAELIDWSNALERLMGSGDAKAVADRATRLGHRLARDWALAGQRGQRPELDRLGNALRGFGDALDTVRVGELLLGLPSCGKAGRDACAAKLVDAIDKSRHAVNVYAPPLAPLLDEIKSIAEPLTGAGQSLEDAAGLRSLAALVRLYLRFGRVAEAAAVLREGWVTAYAEADAACPGAADRFNKLARKHAEGLFGQQEKAALTIAQVRNDVEHAGFRGKTLPAETIRKQLERLASEFEGKIENGHLPSPMREKAAGRVYFVSQYSGAKEWAAAEGLLIDAIIDQLDIEVIHPGDTVIGSLPINLAAAVCKRGGRYQHLTLDLPPELRGEDLTAEEMRDCGARIEGFRIHRES